MSISLYRQSINISVNLFQIAVHTEVQIFKNILYSFFVFIIRKNTRPNTLSERSIGAIPSNDLTIPQSTCFISLILEDADASGYLIAFRYSF